jgi:hypothetical protein
VIVLLSPVLAEASGLRDRSTPPAVEAAIAQAPVKARVLSGLPGASRGNNLCLKLRRLQPRRDPLRHACRPVSTFARRRSPTVAAPARQSRDDIRRSDRAGPGDGQALPRVFVTHRQALQPPAIGGLGLHNVRAPDRRRRGCPRRGAVLSPSGRRFPTFCMTCRPSRFRLQRTVSRFPPHWSFVKRGELFL